MNEVIAQNRKAIAGIAGIFLAAGFATAVLGLASPNFVQGFAANATEVVTGETPAVAVVLESTEASVGVFADN